MTESARHPLPQGRAFSNGAHQHVFRYRHEGAAALLHASLLERFRFGRSEAWALSFYPGRVRLNGAPVQADTPVRPGDEVTYLHLRAEEPDVPPLGAPLHEDPWLLALAKGDTAPVSPAGSFYFGSLAIQAREAFGEPELTPLHRLDLETSGPVLFARHSADLARWHRLFHTKALGKRYRALVHGVFPGDLREIRGRIVPDAASRIFTRLRLEPEPAAEGQPAEDSPADTAGPRRRGKGAEVSLTRVLEVRHLRLGEHGDFSELVLEPVTGKTNQLRVHLAHVGHPIVGDKKYHPDEAVFLDWHAHRDFERLRERLLLPRQALHCDALTFVHPFTGEALEIRAPAAMWPAKLAGLAPNGSGD